MMLSILDTTDGKYLGKVFDSEQPLFLSNSEFVPDKVIEVAPGEFRFSNSSYVIDVKEI